MRVNPIQRALKLRETLVQEDKSGTKSLLVVDYSKTLQGKDTSKIIDLMPNGRTKEYVFRTKINVKDIDPIATKRDSTYFDVSKKTDKEIEDHIKKAEFDFPLWFKYNEGFKMKRVLDYNPPFILQVAGCNFHDGSSMGGCWYCYVDNKSNDGVPGEGKALLTTRDTINSMLSARKKLKEIYKEAGSDLELKVLRCSGGEPTLALDWILDLWREVQKRGLNFVGQIDSNLSTAMVVDRFEQEGIYEKDILKKLAQYPIKVLTAIKGCDQKSLQKNVQSTATIDQQVFALKRFIDAGFDIYPQMYNPNPKTLRDYLKMMDEKIENFSLKTHIGPLKAKYETTIERLTQEAVLLKKNPEEHIRQREKEWKKNYERSTEIINDHLRKRHRVEYKDVARPDVKLKIKC